jgi:hypothetical protein
LEQKPNPSLGLKYPQWMPLIENHPETAALLVLADTPARFARALTQESNHFGRHTCPFCTGVNPGVQSITLSTTFNFNQPLIKGKS